MAEAAASVAIALFGITALTQRRRLLYLAWAFAAIGILVGLAGFAGLRCTSAWSPARFARSRSASCGCRAPPPPWRCGPRSLAAPPRPSARSRRRRPVLAHLRDLDRPTMTVSAIGVGVVAGAAAAGAASGGAPAASPRRRSRGRRGCGLGRWRRGDGGRGDGRTRDCRLPARPRPHPGVAARPDRRRSSGRRWLRRSRARASGAGAARRKTRPRPRAGDRAPTSLH